MKIESDTPINQKSNDPIERYEAAKAYFSNRGIDVEKFLADTDVDDLLEESLGPSDSCLSTNAVAAMVDTPSSLGLHISNETASGSQHVAVCKSCAENVRQYSEIAESREAHTQQGRSSGFGFDLSIRPLNDWKVALSKSGDMGLSFIVYGMLPGDDLDIDPASVSLTGAVRAKGCRIEEVQDSDESIRVFNAWFEGGSSEIIDNGTPACDWLQVNGLTDRGSFESRALVCISPHEPLTFGNIIRKAKRATSLDSISGFVSNRNRRR